jgi:hypothetical protein
MRKLTIHILLTVLAIFAVVGSAMAQNETVIADAGGNSNAGSNYVVWNPSTGLTDTTRNGKIEGRVGNGPLDSDVTLNFSTLAPVTGPGSYSYNSVSGAFVQNLSGGTFTITANGTGTTLLSGTFGPSQLSGNNGAASSGVQLQSNSVTYTGGTYFPTSGFSMDNGSLSLTFTGGDSIVAGLTGVSGYTTGDQIVFSAVPVQTTLTPEPASFATFGIGALALLGLAFAAKRRSLNASL